MPIMKNDWVNSTLLNNPAHKRFVRASVYVMHSVRSPGSFHIGIIGRNSLRNTAQNRLDQVNGGHPALAKFKYIFLAPLPDDLGHQLGVVEKLLQVELSNMFGGRATAPIWVPNPPANITNIQKRAQEVVLCFLQNRYAGSAAALTSALQTFVSLAVPFQQDPNRYNSFRDFLNAETAREKVFVEAQKVFDVHIAQAFLKCLQPTLTVSGLPPCDAIPPAEADDPDDDFVRMGD